MMAEVELKIVSPSDVNSMSIDPVDPVARQQASEILSTVKEQGITGLIDIAVRLKDIENKDSKIFYTLEELEPFFLSLSEESRSFYNT
jgi:nucleoside diphosphate kinase